MNWRKEPMTEKQDEYENTKLYWEKIHNIEKEYGCRFISLLSWTIPAEKFDHYLKEHCYD